MNAISRVLLACALATLAAPAFAAPMQAHIDCDADEPDRNIAGCTRIIDDLAEGAHMRSIALVGRALAHNAKGDRDHAMADFTAAIALDPRNALAYSDRGVLWREKGDPDRAIADFTRAIEIDALPHSDIGGNGHINIYANRALAYKAKGDLDRAIADFDQAIKRDPADPDLYDTRAHTFVLKNQPDRALPDLDAALRLAPDRAADLYMRGVIRYERYLRASAWIEQSDLDGAVADLTRSITLAPGNAEAHYARGLAFVMDGRRDRAAADFAEAVRLNPDDAQMAEMYKRFRPGTGG